MTETRKTLKYVSIKKAANGWTVDIMYNDGLSDTFVCLTFEAVTELLIELGASNEKTTS